MNRNGNLFDLIANDEALFRAYLAARRRKRKRYACHRFERRLGGQLNDILKSLRNGSYEPRPASRFWISEPKLRLIEAPAFRDLVVQHAIYTVVMPCVERRLHRANYACRAGMGTHRCADAVQALLRAAPPGAFSLHLDVRKFFPSIDRDICMRQLGLVIKCARTLELIGAFMRVGGPLGLPIGNLLSQMLALLYLNDLDQFIARELRCRRFARYMDDTILIAESLAEAEKWRDSCQSYLAEKLRLGVSRADIKPVRQGVDFCGYRTWRRTRFIRRRSLHKATAAVRAGNRESFISLLGHARGSASWGWLMTYCKERNDVLYQALPESHRRAHAL